MQKNQPPRRVAQHLRHDRQQHDLRRHLDHPVPQQDGPAGAKGQEPGHGHPLVLSAVYRQPALDPRRAELYPADVYERAQKYEKVDLPPLYERRRHAEHPGRVQFRQGFDPQAEPDGADAAVESGERFEV